MADRQPLKIPAETLARARGADILAIAQRLGASLKKVSTVEWAGPCLLCGGQDRFSINTRQQVWHCRGCDKGGNPLDLTMHIKGIGLREAVAYLTGEDTDKRKPATPAPARPKPSREPANDEASNAFVIWLVAGIVRELSPVRGTSGEKFLAEARKIDVDAIADVLERTDAIAWHPSVLFREEGHALDGKRLGALIGIMTDPITAKPTGAISRTFIHEGRKIGKAKTLGSPVGIVRLSADEDVVGGLCLAEGLETCLAAMAKGFRPAWACGSAGLLAAFPVLAGVEAHTLFADNDASGTGLRAASQAAARWRAAGRETHVYLCEVLGDFNDVLLETGR
jgi:hypothetical protein